MARYSIADTTLTALGDAVRSVVGETRIEKVPMGRGIHNLTVNTGGGMGAVQGTYTAEIGWYLKIKILEEVPSTITIMGVVDGAWITIELDENNEYTFPGSNSHMIRIVNNGSEVWNCTLLTFSVGENGEEYTTEIEVPNTLTPIQMAEVINNLPPVPPESALIISGNFNYRFAYNSWNWFIDLYGDKITTKNLQGLDHTFYLSSDLKEIPFELNMFSSSVLSISYAFSNCSKLEAAPKINNFKVSSLDNLFSGCYKLKSFPEGFAENWDWSINNSATSAYSYGCNKMFYQCHNLRSIPNGLLGQNKYNPMIYPTYSFYHQGFSECFSLEQVENIPVHYKTNWTGNGMAEIFTNCCRLKKITFATQEDGSPIVATWKSQVLDLTKTGYCLGISTTFKNKTDFTDDTRITTPEQWHGYINGTYPDGWSENLEYSTFGKTAATELINTLPDTSAYLASGGTNTVKFKSGSASAIEGEKLGDLPEEVIAVAAAKGWTVSFA